MKFTKKSLWIDDHQDEQRDGRAFGFIGTHGTDQYQGWFFVWPSAQPTISTTAQREAVIASLEADETTAGEPQIPFRWARQTLAQRLRSRFDLRRKAD